MRELSYIQVIPDEPFDTYYDRKIAYFNNAILEHPEDKVHLMQQILIYMLGKDPDEQISYAFELQKADVEMRFACDVYVILARAYTDKNDINQAIEYYRKAIAIDPTEDETIMDLAALYEKQKDYESAISVYDYLDNKDIEYGKENMYRNKGTIYYNRQEWDKALDCYQKAYDVSIDDLDVGTLESLAETYWQMGNYSESIAWFNQALEKDPQSWNAHYGMGLCYERIDDSYRALHHYFEAIRIKPDCTNAYNNIAAVTINKEGDIKGGIEMLNKALENNTDKESLTLIYQNLSRVYHAIYEYDLAKHYKAEFLKSVGLECFISEEEDFDEDDDCDEEEEDI